MSIRRSIKKVYREIKKVKHNLYRQMFSIVISATSLISFIFYYNFLDTCSHFLVKG
uniref:MDN1 domain-containing protein n=1 Tax=Sideroxylon spinosum TaxID=2945705 RepID=A0A1L6KYN0_SIDSP|nr:MDN1 domain-containing protein [Argania spinosa]